MTFLPSRFWHFQATATSKSPKNLYSLLSTLSVRQLWMFQQFLL